MLLVLRTTEHPRLGNDIAVLQMTSVLVAVLDDAGEGYTAYLPARKRLLVLASDIFHGFGLEGDAMVGQDAGHVDAEDGLLDGEETGELDGAVDENSEGRVTGLGG